MSKFQIRLISLVFVIFGIHFMGCKPIRTELMKSEELFSDPKVLFLASAAESGDEATIERLLKEGVDVNAVGKGNATPLSRALHAKNKTGYRVLLEHGANPNIIDPRGLGVTNFAALEEDPFWLEQALIHGGDPNLVSKGNSLGAVTPIFFAIDKGRVANVRLLIQRGANINYQDEVGQYPLLHAVLSHEYEIALLLLTSGANPKLVDQHGYGFLSHISNMEESIVLDAQRKHYRSIVALLQKNGISARAKQEK